MTERTFRALAYDCEGILVVSYPPTDENYKENLELLKESGNDVLLAREGLDLVQYFRALQALNPIQFTRVSPEKRKTVNDLTLRLNGVKK